MNLVITEKDTKPIVCSVGFDITDYTFTLRAVHVKNPEVVYEETAEKTDWVKGIFQFPRTIDSFIEGTYTAVIKIDHPTGSERTAPFYINVTGVI